MMSLPPPPLKMCSVIAVDEGLDLMLRIDPLRPSNEWMLPLKDKCRSLQLLPNGAVLAVTDSGWLDVDALEGTIRQETRLFATGVISAQRLVNGHTFCGGLNLNNQQGVTFVQVDEQNQIHRSVCFGGDYVRRSTLTPEDTILFTCDSRVCEGDWSGKIIREFSAPGFKHAWKAVRLQGDRTLISAGYGAFAVEFDSDCRVIRRWECTEHIAQVRPFFFGDFELLSNGGLLVCNWLGHGTNLGATGCSLLRFDQNSRLVGAWQDAARTSSLQTFVRLPA